MNRQDARIILNSLKNGVVPKDYLGNIIVGRNFEIEEFERNLENLSYGTGSIKIVLGNYGTGKTFLVNVFKELALYKDYVVSSFQIDRVLRMNKLDDLYYYLMHNLYVKGNDKVATFDNIFDIWISNLKHSPDKMHASNEINSVIKEMRNYNETFARALLSFIRYKIKGDTGMLDTVSAWLSGEKNIPYEVKMKFNVIGNVDKSNVFDFLKAFSKLVNLLGYNGLVVMIDEVDLILNERSDIRSQAYSNIKHLIDITASGDLNSTMFLFSGAESIIDDTEKGFRSSEALSQRLGDHIDSYKSSLVDLRQPIIKLKDISIEDFDELTIKIVKIYKSGFDINLSISNESLKNWVFYTYNKEGKNIKTIKIREFIIKLISILDTIDQNPDNYIYKNDLKLSFNGDQPVFKNVLTRAK